MNLILKPIRTSFNYGDLPITLETGAIARQATSAVIVDANGTVVMVTVVALKKAAADADFFPLRIDYSERGYAVGKIPGGFFKREGRPSEREILISRLIDRPLRPLFPEGFMNEVQIVATVISINPEIDVEIPALIGASAALAISGVPFNGPVGAARVGFDNGTYILNPTVQQLKHSSLNLVVAGTESSVLMVESEADELSEAEMLGAVLYGHDSMQVVINAIKEFAAAVNTPKWEWQAPAANTALYEKVKAEAETKLRDAYKIKDKQQRYQAIDDIKALAVQAILNPEDANSPKDKEILAAINNLEREIVRWQILKKESRIDGRDTVTVRPIAVNVGVLPRVHGSALFTRGETQALVTATLGTDKDAQVVEQPWGDTKERFLLHYNFPPYSVGEVGMIGSPKRREIGHGNLARRGLQAVMPADKEFPYVIRVVSEITESNGSSSMATVCGTSLALMDAGIPLKAPVAGVAMGLIKEGDAVTVLTDILGDEDHLGDMDFKVAGTANGITALQMDIKIDGITKQIMEQALEQAKAGRMHILGLMNQVIASPRTDLSPYAPRITTIKIHPDKIRDVIGKGGATIKGITEETGSVIEIADDGTVSIISNNEEASLAAKNRVEMLTSDIEIGAVYEGKVTRIVDFGAFVTLRPGKDGLLHISQITNERVNSVEDYLTPGQVVQVKVTDIDRQGRIRLTMKDLATI